MAGNDTVAAAIQMLVAALQQPQQSLTSAPPAVASNTEKETTPAPSATLSVPEQQAIVERVGIETGEQVLTEAFENFDDIEQVSTQPVAAQHAEKTAPAHTQSKEEDDSHRRRKSVNPDNQGKIEPKKNPLSPWDAFFPTEELNAVYQRKMVMGGWRPNKQV